MTNTISINTPKGLIEAQVIESKEFPGIKITVDGISVAFVEFDSIKDVIQVCTYDALSDDPKYLYQYE